VQRYADDIFYYLQCIINYSGSRAEYFNKIHPSATVFIVALEHNDRIFFLDWNRTESLFIPTGSSVALTDHSDNSDHAFDQQLTAYGSKSQGMSRLPLSNRDRTKELNTIITIANNSGCGTNMIN
jgi:hypothetical protein